MTDTEKKLALKALEEFRAGIAPWIDGEGYHPPDYALAPAEPVGERGGCYVYRLTPAVNGYTGFVLGDAIYPIADKADLARAINIIRDLRWVHKEAA